MTVKIVIKQQVQPDMLSDDESTLLVMLASALVSQESSPLPPQDPDSDPIDVQKIVDSLGATGKRVAAALLRETGTPIQIVLSPSELSSREKETARYILKAAREQVQRLGAANEPDAAVGAEQDNDKLFKIR